MKNGPLATAIQNLKSSEADYRLTLRDISEAINTLNCKTILGQSRFLKVLECRKEVRRLTCVGSELAAEIYGYRVDPASWGDEPKVVCTLKQRDVEHRHVCESFVAGSGGLQE